MQTIRIWLERIGLAQYADAFERDDLDLDVLRDVSEEDLHRLGVSLGHRKRILRAIQALREESDPYLKVAGPCATVIESTTFDGERRQVTVLFCDLVDSTGLSNTLDPEVYRGLLARYHETAIRAIQRFDGYVAQIQGDGIVAYFGYPLAHEGEADRAVRAGLEVIRALDASNRESGDPLQVRVGIASGLVVVSHVLAPDKSAIGETPNLAHRLQTLAQPGEVMIGERTRTLAGGGFDYEDHGLHALKGIAGMTRVWRVRGTSTVASRFDAATRGQVTPMVGRGQEIGLLVDRWERARGGGGQVVLLQGEPGIGKSRMLHAVRDHANPSADATQHYQCSPYYTNSAFYPFVDQLERAVGFDRDDSVEQRLDKLEACLLEGEGRTRTDCNLLARALALPAEERYGALDVTPQRQKEDTITLLVDIAARAAHSGAALVLFEDVHWADPTTIEVLTALVDRAETLSMLVLITYRPEFQPPWLSRLHVTAIALGRLTRVQGASIVLRVSGDKPLPGDLVKQIVDKTDGVPLFLEELTKAVLESEMLLDRGDRYEYSERVERLAIPSTLRDSLMARLDRLIPVKEIAQIGAVLGREFSYELVRAVSPMNEKQLDEALDRLTESELVFRRGSIPNAVYTFKHALVQDAAYDSLLRTRRQGLHEQIARAIEERFPDKVNTEPELLAHHYTEAGLLAAAIPFWQKAGELAQQRVALQEAIGYFERGLRIAEQLPASAERDAYRLQLRALLGMAWLALQGWGHPAVEDNLQHAYALEETVTPGEHSLRVLWGLWVYPLATGRPRGSLVMAEELLAQATRRGDEQMLHAGLWAQATTYHWLGEYDNVLAAADAILDRYDPIRHRPLADALNHDPKTVALQYKAAATHAQGYVDRAAAMMEETLHHSRIRNHAFDHVWALYFAMHQLHGPRRDAEAFERLIPEFETRARTQRLLMFENLCAPYLRAMAEMYRGRYAEASEQLEPLLPHFHAMGLMLVHAHMLMELAECAVETGGAVRALELVGQALSQIRQPGHELGYLCPELLRVQGCALQRTGRSQEATVCFRSAMEMAAAQKARWWQLRSARCYAEMLEEDGRRAEARALLQPIFDWFTEGHHTKDLQAASALLRRLS